MTPRIRQYERRSGFLGLGSLMRAFACPGPAATPTILLGTWSLTPLFQEDAEDAFFGKEAAALAGKISKNVDFLHAKVVMQCGQDGKGV